MNVNRHIPKGQHRQLRERILSAYRQAVNKHGACVTMGSVPGVLVIAYDDAEAAILRALDRRRKT